MLEPGKKLQERYRVERQVGQGGMGSVYLATDERFHSTVAIKEAFYADEKYRKAFAREARLLNSLKHSALPKVTDHFAENDGQYIVMEYIGGDDLFEKMRKSGHAFPVADVLEWSDQLLDALSYLHEQGIIHRDIKPQNLKLTPQGRVILLDFGLAKGNPSDANFQSAAQSIFGYSRNYASLEQIQGTGTDPRSDVYSLAATVYHLMTARVPADALTRVMKVVNDHEDPLEPAGLFNSDISQEVSDALDKCLALKANSRPQSASEMRSMLFVDSHTKFTVASGRETAAGGDDLLTRETQVIDEPAGSDPRPQSGIKTEVIPGSSPDSAETLAAIAATEANRDAAVTADNPARSKKGPVAAGITAVAVIGAVAATVTFWPVEAPDVPPVESEMRKVEAGIEQPTAVEDVSDPEPGPAESGPPAADDRDRAPATPQISQKRTDSDSKNKPKVSSGKNKETKTGEAAPADGVRVTESSVEAGSAVVTRDKVEIRPTPPPRRPPPNLPIPREQFEKLTPQQKLRLLRRIERERRLRNEQRPVIRRPPAEPPPF